MLKVMFLAKHPCVFLGDDLADSIVVGCCFTPTETMRTIRDGEPRTATSTFTQF